MLPQLLGTFHVLSWNSEILYCFMKLFKQFLSRSSPWCSALPSSPSRFWLVPFASLFIRFSGLLLEFWTLDEWFGHGQQCWKLPTLCKLQIPQVCSKRLGGRATRIKGKSHPARTKDGKLSCAAKASCNEAIDARFIYFLTLFLKITSKRFSLLARWKIKLESGRTSRVIQIEDWGWVAHQYAV